MRLLRVLAFCLFAAAAPAAAQTYTAAKIVFNHPGPYTQAQLETAAGMHKGTSFTAEGLGDAAQRLVDTGFFGNVGATLAPGRYEAITVLFDIKPIDRSQMVHVAFQNFAWLSHEEIEDALQAKAPLFLDYLPENSPLLGTFNAALADALARKGVKATISHETIEPTTARPERNIEFRIVAPTLRVTNVKLGGVPQELAPLVQKSVNAAARAPYSERTADLILAPLRDAGYIQAALSDIKLDPTIADDAASVVFSATLTPGDVYHVSAITFAGTPLLSADAFAATEKLHAGDVASRALLLQTLAPLDAAYRQQGYMDVVVEAVPTVDAAAHQVAYTVTVTPGEQYRVNEVTANNLDPVARENFNRQFTMKTGDLYNPGYITEFLKSNVAQPWLAGYGESFKATADPNNHTVDLELTFVHGANVQPIPQ